MAAMNHGELVLLMCFTKPNHAEYVRQQLNLRLGVVDDARPVSRTDVEPSQY